MNRIDTKKTPGLRRADSRCVVSRISRSNPRSVLEIVHYLVNLYILEVYYIRRRHFPSSTTQKSLVIVVIMIRSDVLRKREPEFLRGLRARPYASSLKRCDPLFLSLSLSLSLFLTSFFVCTGYVATTSSVAALHWRAKPARLE